MLSLGTRGLRRIAPRLSIAAVIWLVAATGAMAGNNGTLKIHELDTPEGTVNNDPKVCSFNVEAFNLDPGQIGYLVFFVQGGDAPHGSGPLTSDPFGPANDTGYAESGYFSLDPGHYKATLYGKSGPNGDIDLTDIKAKSKVFKVTCAGGGE